MKLHVPITLRWSDLDAYGHVNTAAMLRLLEEARIQAFWLDEDATEPALGAGTAVLDGRPGAATLTLIGRLEAEYLAPIPYLRQPVVVRLWEARSDADVHVLHAVFVPIQPAHQLAIGF